MSNSSNSVLIGQLLRACEGSGEDREDFVTYAQESEAKSKLILDYILKKWHSDTDELKEEAAMEEEEPATSPHELLRLALALPHIAWDALFECMKCLNLGTIIGRNAIHCVSELRSFLSMHHAQQHQLAHQEAAKVTQHLISVAELCLAPFSKSSANSSRSQKSRLPVVCLELLPVVAALVTSRSGSAQPASSVGPNLPVSQHSSNSVLQNILNGLLGAGPAQGCLLDQHYGNAVALPALLSCCCDLYAHLEASHVDSLERAILSAATVSATDRVNGDTLLVSLFRSGMLLLNLSRDVRWVMALRSVYETVSMSVHATQVEGLLEQLLFQAVANTHSMIVSVIEDLAVRQCKRFASKSQEQLNEGRASQDIGGSDLRLMLMLYRSFPIDSSISLGLSCRGSSSSGLHTETVIALPSSFDDNRSIPGFVPDSNGGSYASNECNMLHLARCVVMIILCLAQAECDRDNFHTAGAWSDAIRSAVSQVKGPSHLKTPQWLTSFRMTAFINLVLQSIAHPQELRSCLLAVTHGPATGFSSQTDDALSMRVEELASLMLQEVFRLYTASRPALLGAILRGIVVCVERGDRANGIQKASTQVSPTPLVGWDGHQATIDCFLDSLKRVCSLIPVLYTRSDENFSDTEHKIYDECIDVVQTFTPALLHNHNAHPSVLERFLSGISDISSFSDNVYAAVHSSCRKVLLRHRDVRIQQVAIRALVGAITSSASSHCGYLEGIQTLLYSLSLPLQSRRVVFEELNTIANDALVLQSKNASKAGVLPGRTLFRTLRDRLVETFSAYFLPEHDKQERASAALSPQCVFMPQCCSRDALRMQRFAGFVAEDIEMVLSLLHTLDSVLVGCETVAADIVHVAQRLSSITSVIEGSNSLQADRGVEAETECTSVGSFLHGVVNFILLGCPDGSNNMSPSLEEKGLYFACVHAALSGVLQCLERELIRVQSKANPGQDNTSIDLLRSASLHILMILDLLFESFSNADADLKRACEDRCATILSARPTTTLFGRDIPVDGHMTTHISLSAWYFLEENTGANTSSGADGIAVGMSPSFSIALESITTVLQVLLPQIRRLREGTISFPYSTLFGALSYACHSVSRACSSSSSRAAVSYSDLSTLISHLHSLHDSVCTVRTESFLIELSMSVDPDNALSKYWAKFLQKVPVFMRQGLDRWDVPLRQTDASNSMPLKARSKRALRKAIRSCLFGMRVELLYAVWGCYETYNEKFAMGLTKGGPQPRAPWSCAEGRVLQCLQYSTDLLHASQAGTTKGVVRYTFNILQSLLHGVSVPDDMSLRQTSAHIAILESQPDFSYESNLALAREYAQEQEKAEVTQQIQQKLLSFNLVLLAQDLWGVLPHLDTSQVNLIAPLLRHAVRVSGRHHGMQRIFSLLTAIGRDTAKGINTSHRDPSHHGDSFSDSELDSEVGLAFEESLRTEEQSILHIIKQRNTLQDHERLFGPSSPSMRGTCDADARTLMDSDDETSTTAPQESQRVPLLGVKSEAAVFMELIKIATEFARRCEQVEYNEPDGSAPYELTTPDVQGLDLVRMKYRYPFAYSTSVFCGYDPSSWAGKCAFCLFQPVKLTGSEPPLREPLKLLLNSPHLPQSKRASVVAMAAKWFQWATKNITTFSKELLAYTQAKESLAIQQQKLHRLQQKERAFFDSRDNGNTAADSNVNTQKTKQIMKSGPENKTKKKRFAHLLYVLCELGPKGFTTIREWIYQQAEASEHQETGAVQKSRNKRKKKSAQEHGSLSTAHNVHCYDDNQVVSVAEAKQLQLLLHRTDQFLWALRHVLGELDRPRKVDLYKSFVEDKDAYRLQLPTQLHAPLDAVDVHGRHLLSLTDKLNDNAGLGFAKCTQEDRIRKKAKYSNTDKASRGSFAKTLGAEDRHSSGTRNKRIRSRNRVVDAWLGEEEGYGDAYADLEDFLVE